MGMLNLSKQFHVLQSGQTLATILSENVRFQSAARTEVVAHVLQQAQHWDIDLAKQSCASHCISQGNVLRMCQYQICCSQITPASCPICMLRYSL